MTESEDCRPRSVGWMILSDFAALAKGDPDRIPVLKQLARQLAQ